jgi:hypothetical protein
VTIYSGLCYCQLGFFIHLLKRRILSSENIVKKGLAGGVIFLFLQEAMEPS